MPIALLARSNTPFVLCGKRGPVPVPRAVWVVQEESQDNMKCGVIALFVLNMLTIVAIIIVATQLGKIDSNAAQSGAFKVGAVQDASIQDSAITATKLAPAAVTRANIAANVAGRFMQQAADGSLTLATTAGVSVTDTAVVLGASKNMDELRSDALKFGATPLSLPVGDGSAGQTLATDGSASVVFTTATGPAGATGPQGFQGAAGSTVRCRGA